MLGFWRGIQQLCVATPCQGRREWATFSKAGPSSIQGEGERQGERGRALPEANLGSLGLFLNWIHQVPHTEGGRKLPDACYELWTRPVFTRTPVLLGYIQQGSRVKVQGQPAPFPRTEALFQPHTVRWVVSRTIPRAKQKSLPSMAAACCRKRPALASSCSGAENPSQQ